MLWSLDDGRTTGCSSLDYPYFEQAEPLVWDEGGTYVETDRSSRTTVTHEWNHGLGEIVTALLDAGLRADDARGAQIGAWDALPGADGGRSAAANGN